MKPLIAFVFVPPGSKGGFWGIFEGRDCSWLVDGQPKAKESPLLQRSFLSPPRKHQELLRNTEGSVRKSSRSEDFLSQLSLFRNNFGDKESPRPAREQHVRNGQTLREAEDSVISCAYVWCSLAGLRNGGCGKTPHTYG
eukprot:gene25819-biopygen8965